MKQTSYFILAIFLASCAGKSDNTHEAIAQTVANGRDSTITFFRMLSHQKLPSSWSAETGTWATELENANVSLKMTSNDGSDFNIVVLKSNNYHAEIEARVKPLRGDEDQGGGPVLQCENHEKLTQ